MWGGWCLAPVSASSSNSLLLPTVGAIPRRIGRFGCVTVLALLASSSRVLLVRSLKSPLPGRAHKQFMSTLLPMTRAAAPEKPCTPWKVYPSWEYDALVDMHGSAKVKLIYVVRHAEGTHNVKGDYKSIEQLDARLTDVGVQQCFQLKDDLFASRNHTTNSRTYNQPALKHLLENVEKDDIRIVVSPLTRCIQTALFSFDFLILPKDTIGNTRFLGLEALRETVNYNCDRRRQISQVAKEFPQVDFSACLSDEDELWMSYREREEEIDDSTEGTKRYLESAQLYVVAIRGREALRFLESLPQSKLIVCTHSAYLRCILNWGQTGGVPKMFEQRLDDREDPLRQDKVFEYCVLESHDAKDEAEDLRKSSFEDYMRKDYENAELRSFCLLVQ